MNRPSMLFAFKAIALDRALSRTETSVAAAILDSFNRTTKQCDPSFDRLAHLLGISRRSVIRAVNKLVARRFLLRDRHGGKSHRNSYTPNWVRFEEVEAAWSAKKRTKHWSDGGAKLSPLQCQASHLAGDSAVTQTYISNLSNKTCVRGTAQTAPPPSDVRESRKGSATGSVGPGRSTASNPSTASNHQAIDEHAKHLVSALPTASATPLSRAQSVAAARRLSGDLHHRFADDKTEYGRVVEAINEGTWASAVQAEARGRGKGLALILAALAGLVTSHDAPNSPSGPIDRNVEPAAAAAAAPADDAVASVGPGTADRGEPS